MRSSHFLALAALATPLAAQYSDDFEAYSASAAGTFITGQNGYYIPVAGSLDGFVATYAGNAWGVPVNPNGGNNFYVGISQATNVFARAQKTINVPQNGLVYVQYDVCCNYVGLGTPNNNIGSFSFQPSGTSVHVNTLARWPATATVPPTWDADVVVGTTQTNVGDPAFLGLDVNVWHTWGVTADLAAGVYVEFRITNGTTGVTTVFVPPTPMALPNAGLAHPTDFRFFTGGSDNLFATDNLIVDCGGTYEQYGAGCAGSLGVPTLAAAAGSRPRIGTTFTAELSNLPIDSGLLATGFSDATAFGGAFVLPLDLGGFGFPGCFLLADPLVSQFLVGAGGVAMWPLTIPNDVSFVGVEMWQQGVSLDTVAPGAAFSNGGRLKIGY